MAPHRLINSDWKTALVGSVLFNVGNLLDWIFNPILLDMQGFAIELAMKLFSTILLGAGGAISALFAKDMYRIIKSKIKNHHERISGKVGK
jgi:hypothetical protein